MDDVQAFAPGPGAARTYQPLPGADRSVWAWEFARRRGRARDGAPAGAPQAGGAPELCFVGDGPAGDPLPIVLWRWQADGRPAAYSCAHAG